MIMYRDPNFNVDQMQRTMRHMLLDEQSRKGPKGGIAGKGFTMATSTPTTCFEYRESGHIRRNCPQRRGKGRQQKPKPAGASKWCSIHFTTKHSDEECYEQGSKRPEKSGDPGKAFTACTHCSSVSDKKDPATAKEVSNLKAAIDFNADGDESDERFMYANLHSGKKAEANSSEATLFVDTGATETMLDDRLIPGLTAIMQEYKRFARPKTIKVGGDHELKGTATGVIQYTVKDSHGGRQAVTLLGLIVSGLGLTSSRRPRF